MKTNLTEQLETFRALVEADRERYRIACGYADWQFDTVSKTVVHIWKKWARVDVGHSGKYMVDMETGEIVGIKAYGVPHLGHSYGTLDTIHEFDWSDYVGRRKPAAATLELLPVSTP